MRLLLALLSLAAACSSSTSERSKPRQAVGDAAPGQTSPVGAKKKDVEADRRARAQTALARIPEIKRGLARLRQLAFKRDVPAEYQPEAAFRAFVRRDIAKEMPPARADALVTAYVQLGLLVEKIDLPRTIEDAMVSQAGAYYDPEQKKYFLVMVPTSDMMLDTITAHELTHALQDQYFDLQRYNPTRPDGTPALDDDAATARRFVVEGEATFTMIAYLAAAMTKMNVLDPKLLGTLETQLNMMAGMDVDQLKAMSKEQQSGLADMGEEMKAAVAAMDSIPPALLVPLLESYTKGALPVFQAYKQGGWAEVARLYSRPPDSTEQVLHPAEKLLPTRDLPRSVTVAIPPGCREVYSNTIGELGWRVYFLLWKKEVSDAAAAGWDGDRYAVVRDGAGALVALIATAWDSEAEAQEFERAYRASLVARFGGDGLSRPGGARIQVERRGASVFVVDGSGDPALLTALERPGAIR